MLQMHFFRLGTGSDWLCCTAFEEQPASSARASSLFFTVLSLSKQDGIEDSGVYDSP